MPLTPPTLTSIGSTSANDRGPWSPPLHRGPAILARLRTATSCLPRIGKAVWRSLCDPNRAIGQGRQSGMSTAVGRGAARAVTRAAAEIAATSEVAAMLKGPGSLGFSDESSMRTETFERGRQRPRRVISRSEVYRYRPMSSCRRQMARLPACRPSNLVVVEVEFTGTQ